MENVVFPDKSYFQKRYELAIKKPCVGYRIKSGVHVHLARQHSNPTHSSELHGCFDQPSESSLSFFSASEYSIVNFVTEIMCLFSNPYILHRTVVIRCLEKN